MFVCQSIERNGKGTEIEKVFSTCGKLKERFIHFGRKPDGYSGLAILRYIYPIHPLHSSSFFVDNGAKLKKMISGDVSYLKKGVSYPETLIINKGNEYKNTGGAFFPILVGKFIIRLCLYLDAEEHRNCHEEK